MTDLLQIIRNIVSYLDDFGMLLSGICFLIGFALTLKALKGAQKRQEQGGHGGSWASPMSNFIVAGLFLGLPTFINLLNVSLFAATPSAPESIFALADSTIGVLEEEVAREMITGLVRIIQFMGLIAVARGLYLLNQSAQGNQGPNTFGPGFTFVVAGICATNFPIFVGIMEKVITA
ncbi:hypothetical protein [Pseudosulfitobacter pseudonitzschiae]|uniref:hypothetical protein n=1 Tax=Pseudosulfitobacter pseudonitzschiae TaxID=1402135 RepID=UPI003B7D24D4